MSVAVASQPAIAVAWVIAREAVRQSMPDLEVPASRRRGGDVLLSIVVTGQSCAAELRDTLTGASHPIELGAVEVETMRADEFLHVIVREGREGLLAATMRENGSASRLLYAHTSLLDRLGIRGGRYSRPTLGS